MSDIDTAVVDSLKVLDPKRPIREADIERRGCDVRYVPIGHCATLLDHLVCSVFGGTLLRLRRAENWPLLERDGTRDRSCRDCHRHPFAAPLSCNSGHRKIFDRSLPCPKANTSLLYRPSLWLWSAC